MKLADNRIEVLVPIAPSDESGPSDESRVTAGGVPGRVLGGGRIGLFWNKKPNGDVLLERLGARLRERYGDTDVVWLAGKENPAQSAPAEAFEEAATLKCDAVLVALGDCGSCTSWSIHDAIELERRGIRAVLVVTDAFEPLAKTAAKAKGLPGLSLLVVKGPIAGISVEDVWDKVDVVVEDAVASLVASTRTYTAASTPVSGYPAETAEIAVTDGEEWIPLYERGWTDGLPVILPTKSRVESMLKGTSHAPAEVVAILPPKGGVATVEIVAINAVMAGCSPGYLPVVLAGVEAIGEPDNNMVGWASTTGSNSPMFIINGPLSDEIGVNYQTNALGAGRRANATIGRALSLIVRNIGGASPGSTDMTTIGAPWEYTMCVAENEKALPDGWLPLNVEQGVPEPNTITAKCINSQVDVFCHNALELTQVLDTIAAGIVGINSLAILQGQGVVIAFGPEVAALSSKEGWTKRTIAQYIYEKARQPLATWKYLGDNWVARGILPEAESESGDYLMRMIPRPEDITVIVTGGPGKRCHWWAGGHGCAVTKAISKWS